MTITQATLRVYVNAVDDAGTIDLRTVSGQWDESTLTAANAPALGASIGSMNISTPAVRKYVSVPGPAGSSLEFTFLAFKI